MSGSMRNFARGFTMKKNSFPRILLYIGLFLMISSIGITIHTLHRISLNEMETVKLANIKIRLDSIESKIRDLIYFPDRMNGFNIFNYSNNRISEINDQLLFLDQQLVENEKELDLIHSIQRKWNQISLQMIPDKASILYELDILNRVIDKRILDEVANRQLSNEIYISRVIVIGFITVALAFIMILLALYLERRELKSKESLLISLKESERKAQESSRAKTMFLAIAGHELRTPLNGIIGLSELLRKSNLPTKETQFIDNIFHSGKSLLKIINNILEFARIESGTIELELSDFNLKMVINQIMTSLSVKAHQKNINLSYEIEKEVPQRLYGDSSRISQVIYNLIGNAIKFTAVGSVSLKVKVCPLNKEKGISLQFDIADTGIGMSEEKMRNLFLPFTAIHSEGTSGEVGSGLGLAISKQIVKSMGGNIEVNSNVGVGSTISFTVLFSKYSNETIGESEKHQLQLPEEHNEITPIFTEENIPNILVVDDNPTNLLMAQAMLERLGAKTISASNGKEAIYEYNKNKVDLILMDCQMPVMDGYQATRELRRQGAAIPIIAMTANTAYEDQDKCFNEGMNGFIAKPFSVENLANDLNTFLKPKYDIVSLEALKNLETNIGNEGASKVVHSFLGELGRVEDVVGQLIKDKRLDELHKIGHKNKSSSLTVGANGLAKLFSNLEKSERIEIADELTKELKLAHQSVKNKLLEHLTHIQ